MYRIFALSYENYKNQVSDARLKQSEPIELLCDYDRFIDEKMRQTELYKKASDLKLYLMEHLDAHHRLPVLIREMERFETENFPQGASSNDELQEQLKTLSMFLNLSYWN